MKRTKNPVSKTIVGAILAVGVASVVQANPTPSLTSGTVSCAPCSGPFILNGQICFLYSCNNGPCEEILCLKF